MLKNERRKIVIILLLQKIGGKNLYTAFAIQSGPFSNSHLAPPNGKAVAAHAHIYTCTHMCVPNYSRICRYIITKVRAKLSRQKQCLFSTNLTKFKFKAETIVRSFAMKYAMKYNEARCTMKNEGGSAINSPISKPRQSHKCQF